MKSRIARGIKAKDKTPAPREPSGVRCAKREQTQRVERQSQRSKTKLEAEKASPKGSSEQGKAGHVWPTGLQVLPASHCGSTEMLPAESERLFINNWSSAVSYARRMGVCDPEQTAMDCMVAAFKGFDENIGPFEARLWTMVRWRTCSSLRSDILWRDRHVPLPDDLESLIPANPQAESDPGVAVEVKSILATLDPAERDLLICMFFCGFTSEEIAEHQGPTTSASAVRNRVGRLLLKLRIRFADFDPNPGKRRSGHAPAAQRKKGGRRAVPHRELCRPDRKPRPAKPVIFPRPKKCGRNLHLKRISK